MHTNTHTPMQVCRFHLLLCAQTVCALCLHISASAYTHLHTPPQERERERAREEKLSADLGLDSPWMETFVQLSCLLLCQSGQCFHYKNERINIYPQPREEASKQPTYSTCNLAHIYRRTYTGRSAAVLLFWKSTHAASVAKEAATECKYL